ncbi:MAG: RNA-binding protein [Phycisphaera sp.]|nr:RNA-binding protein [Phycisphaera sp.]
MKIYVGNLSFKTDNAALEALFAEFGEVQEASIVTDRETGRSRGFGFVTMDDEGAKKAIDELNGKEIEGRTLTINEARPREPRSGGFGGGGGGRGGPRGGGNRGGGGGARW